MLPFYNQFILGPRRLDGFQSWQYFQLWNTHHLIAHPNLKVEKAENEKVAVYLIGYLLDPDRPHASSMDILNSLIDHADRNVDLFKAIEPLGGRWALIFKTPQTLQLVHDAAGLRQVYYSDVGLTGELWCASQPSHIANACALEMDPEAVAFIRWFQDKDKEYWWPGESSPYRSIKRLLPNHYLNLKNGQPIRFWPTQDRKSRPLNEAVKGISNTLSGMIQSAASRFNLAVGMSAGWDSRLMLAASRPVSKKLRYYTIKKTDFEMTHADIEIPTKLLEKLGLEHDLIEVLPNASPEFAVMFDQQVPFAHERRLARMYTNLSYYQRQKVGTTGNVSEVARCFYQRPDPPAQLVTTEYLMKVTHAEHPFAQEHFGRWLNTVEDCRQYNVLDLFYWEQRIGSWFANNCQEFDSAWSDIFVPYNCRRLLMDMLAVDECHRTKPSYELFRCLILKMWPDTLSYPINPHQKQKGLIRYLKRVVRPLKRFLQ